MPHTSIFVAPWGRDEWPGTAEEPLASVAAAQRAVRERTHAMTDDIVVSLRAGTYQLDRTLQFHAAQGDSGNNGHQVTYQSHGYGTDHAEAVVLSGGRVLTGWEQTPSGTWSVGVGDLVVRQLHVDGRRAGRATCSEEVLGNVTKTEIGYVTSAVIPEAWHGASGVEFVYTGVYPWSEARCAVAEISTDGESTTITMAQPAWAWAQKLYDAEWNGDLPDGDLPTGDEPGGWFPLAAPTSIENSRASLTEPGTFTLDRSTPGEHVLHYLPRPGEHPDTTAVIAPVLETLISGHGSLADLTLRGLTFAHAGWSGVEETGGYLHYHGNAHYQGGEVGTVVLPEGMGRITVPIESVRLPANVEFTDATRITVADNHFTHLGAGGLAISGTGIVVRGNTFDDISGSGIAVHDARDCVVEDNLVHDIGLEYRGSPAIIVSESREVTVRHNEVHHTPHCGIVVHGGDRTRGTRVLSNLVHHTMTVLADGGGIYLSAPQGASYASGAVVRGNVVRDTITSYNFGLYTDYGAAWVTVQGNVVHRGDTPVVLAVAPPLANVAFIGNFWDDVPAGYDTPPDTVIVGGNTVLPKDSFEEALAASTAGADILATAGRRSATS
ncbi:right-handed parallel beta-helix repeat-containing protein [Actinokineospora sp. NBRC 105648]|uniref:right-handed parallel beta-helix repeat-containing protein n=1 Tax=Actinokineospora sp. NBRC 105648 TaxID=3032206 RepID=UPI0024A405BD|nr:right-handed parallel beta-helix repeat-containing protein [Actinokineospora sp. NBRC 105648]GLZ43485.1 hypothetical protein Acsp05_71090 [Actinokineospora sp. NBRC 105648]